MPSYFFLSLSKKHQATNPALAAEKNFTIEEKQITTTYSIIFHRKLCTFVPHIGHTSK